MSKLVLKPQRKLRKMVTSRDPTDMCSGAEEEHHGDRANARGGEDKPAAEKLRDLCIKDGRCRGYEYRYGDAQRDFVSGT